LRLLVVEEFGVWCYQVAPGVVGECLLL